MAINNSQNQIVCHHKEGAEWLTYEICKEYMRKAQELSGSCGTDIGQRRALRIELQNRCDITELEAINIINGHNIGLYVSRYEKMKAASEGKIDSSASEIYEVIKGHKIIIKVKIHTMHNEVYIYLTNSMPLDNIKVKIHTKSNGVYDYFTKLYCNRGIKYAINI